MDMQKASPGKLKGRNSPSEACDFNSVIFIWIDLAGTINLKRYGV
jgi:hypothetical protein